MEERKSFFGSPLRAFIFIICVAAVISAFTIGTVFAIKLIVGSPSNGNERITAENEAVKEESGGINNESETVKEESGGINNESETVKEESGGINDESAIPDAAETDPNIGMDEAKMIAVEHAGLSISEVNFSKAKLEKEHRVTVYEIEFYKDGMEYEYEIDAGTGEIIKYESGWDD